MDSIAFSDTSPASMPPPQLMLKDYLLDDMSSCSSNGFRSLPRRQCCGNVQFIREFDLKSPKDLKGKAEPKSPTTSAFRRSVISAVKILPFSSKRRSSILPRSLSMKLCKRTFWKKASDHKEISFLKSLKCQNEDSLSVSQPSSAAAAAVGARKGKSLSSSSSLFTADNLLSSSCNSESSCDNDAVLTPEKPVSKIVAVTAGNDSSASSTETAKEEWVNNNLEEKEQFSPISVLDFPFHNQDDVSWPFRRNVSILKGEKRQLPDKLQIIRGLSILEPVDLNKRFAKIEIIEENKGVRAGDLLEVVKRGCRFGYKIEGLLVDFFNERININTGGLSKSFDSNEAIRVAENWVNGQPEELFLGWEVQKNREVYIKYLENGGKLDEEKEEIAKKIEDEIFSCLLDDLWL